MALNDNLLTEKENLTTLLESEYNQQNLRDQLLQRLFFVRFLLGELVGSGGGGGGGDASAANQTIVQANAGSDASKAVSVQGITNGKPVPVVLSSSPNVNASQSGSWAVSITGTLPSFTTTPTFNIGTSSLAVESGGNLQLLAGTTGTGGTSAPSRTVSIAGIDGGVLRPISVNSSGQVRIAPTGRASDVNSISVTLSNEDRPQIGLVNETAPTNDTNPSGLNGRLQRVAQRITSLIGLVPANLTVTTNRLLVDGSGVTQPISAASLPLPTGAATEATLTTMLTTTAFQARIPSGLTVSATRLLVDNSGVTQPVSAVSLPLPTGAAISANQIPAFTNSPVNLGSANTAVLKASAGAVYRIYCFNKNAAVRYFQIHNKATTPTNGDTPIETFPVAPNSALIIDGNSWGANGRVCSTGVAWAFSTTETTLTLGTASDQTSTVGYL